MDEGMMLRNEVEDRKMSQVGAYRQEQRESERGKDCWVMLTFPPYSDEGAVDLLETGPRGPRSPGQVQAPGTKNPLDGVPHPADFSNRIRKGLVAALFFVLGTSKGTTAQGSCGTPDGCTFQAASTLVSDDAAHGSAK